MQLVNFLIFATFLIASATNAEVTTQSGVTTAINNTSVTNATAAVASLSNDQSNANPTTVAVPPTRVPSNELTTAKEPLVHSIETSSKQPISMVPKVNNITANGTETAGKGSAKTDGKSGASRSTSGFLVISFIFLSLSVIYA